MHLIIALPLVVGGRLQILHVHKLSGHRVQLLGVATIEHLTTVHADAARFQQTGRNGCPP